MEVIIVGFKTLVDWFYALRQPNFFERMTENQKRIDYVRDVAKEICMISRGSIF